MLQFSKLRHLHWLLSSSFKGWCWSIFKDSSPFIFLFLHESLIWACVSSGRRVYPEQWLIQSYARGSLLWGSVILLHQKQGEQSNCTERCSRINSPQQRLTGRMQDQRTVNHAGIQQAASSKVCIWGTDRTFGLCISHNTPADLSQRTHRSVRKVMAYIVSFFILGPSPLPFTDREGKIYIWAFLHFNFPRLLVPLSSWDLFFPVPSNGQFDIILVYGLHKSLQS